MDFESSHHPEKLLIALRAFEKVIEQREQLCQGGDGLARLFGDFFAGMAALKIRRSLTVDARDPQKNTENTAGDKSRSTDAQQLFLPTLNAVRAVMPNLMDAVTSNNISATVAALEEIGVFTLCPDQAEQLSRLEGMIAKAGSGARLVFLVELAVLAVELREFDRVARYVADAHALTPSSWEFYNLCVLEGLLALKAGKNVEALQWLGRSSDACQIDERVSLNCAIRAPNFLLAQELMEQGERSAVIRHLLACKYVWDYAKLPFEKWIADIEHGEVRDIQHSEEVQALNQLHWKLQTAWMRARCLEEGLPRTKPSPKSPAEVLKARNRLVEEQKRHADEIVNRAIKYLDDP